jgi:cytochrome P450
MAVELGSALDELLGHADFVADPYPVYRRLREEHPVYWSERWGSWVLSRYADVMTCLREPGTFSNVGRQAAMLRRLPPERQQAFRALSSHYTAGGLSNQDPPAHTRLRGLVSNAFTPRVVASLAPRIREIVDGLLDGLEVEQPTDLIRRVAYPLPAIVIAELLGLPASDREQFKFWSDEITAFLGTGRVDDASAARGQRSMLALREYLGQMIAKRRHEPRDDLLSRFVAAEERGDVLSDGEVLGSCVTLLLGGHETTTNLIGNGLLALLRNPDQLERLYRDPALIPTAVEEFLRFDAPVQRIWRLVATDIEFAGQRLMRGESVYLMVGAANRDQAQFADPDRLDVGRRPNRHLTFGHGVHFCLGASLARLEASIAFGRLLRRFPRITAAPAGIAYYPNIAFRGLTSLPVVVSSAGGGGTPM